MNDVRTYEMGINNQSRRAGTFVLSISGIFDSVRGRDTAWNIQSHQNGADPTLSGSMPIETYPGTHPPSLRIYCKKGERKCISRIEGTNGWQLSWDWRCPALAKYITVS